MPLFYILIVRKGFFKIILLLFYVSFGEYHLFVISYFVLYILSTISYRYLSSSQTTISSSSIAIPNIPKAIPFPFKKVVFELVRESFFDGGMDSITCHNRMILPFKFFFSLKIFKTKTKKHIEILKTQLKKLKTQNNRWKESNAMSTQSNIGVHFPSSHMDPL